MFNKLLLNPGPTNTALMTKIKQFLGTDVCHREQSFKETLSDLKRLILNVGNINGNVSILAGSGTTALEAMITSLCPPDTLVIDAGKYGSRAVKIFNTYNIDCKVLKSKTSEDLSVSRNIKWVYFVENETSTGENYSLDAMIEKFPNAKFFIDATSSFGATDYSQFDKKIAALSFCSNKCMQSTPGLGIVVWKDYLEVKQRTFFTSLAHYKGDNLPFTLPTQSVAALFYVTKKLSDKNNKTLFNTRRTKIIKALKIVGINCINENPANSIIAFVHPKLSYLELHNFLLARGIVIYSGVPGIKNSFRISTMSVKFDNKFLKIKEAFHDSCLC
tara:strand:+ start:339 stop:1331 length:993 start_codon:yes stop_codon:yes gene_type:complete